MIESILELVLGNMFEATILIVAGFLLGVLISLLYWTRQVRKRMGQIRKRESRIKDLETFVEEKDSDMKEMSVRVQEALNKQKKEIESLNSQLTENEMLLNEREKGIDILNTKLGQREENIRDLNQQISEKNMSIDLLKKEAADLEKSLNIQLGQREENIRDLNQQISEKNMFINLLKKEATDLETKNRDSVTRAEGAETKIGELEKSIGEKEQETASLKGRIRTMQDELTYIVGIGPKVSSFLRSAGINTFAKLGSTDVNRIREILEAENPNLLRLTNPSTWPEQARLASEGDWEALSTLQNRLKGSRRA